MKRYLYTFFGTVALSLVAGAWPSGEFASAEALSATKVRFNWTVSGGSGEAMLVLKYGLSSDRLDFSKELGSCSSNIGGYTADADGFRSGTEYHGRLYVESGGSSRVFGAPFTFETGAGITAKPVYRQAYVDGNAWADGFDIDNNRTVGTVDRPYAVHVSQYNPQSWTVTKDDGTSYTSQWGDNRTFGYHTTVWLDAEKTYTFGINVDDYGSVWIDGAEVFSRQGSGGINIWDIPRQTYKPAATGWHDLKLYVGNGGGGYGPYPCYNYPRSGDTFYIGIGWSTDNATTWNYFDLGTDLFNGRIATVLSASRAGNKVAFNVDFGEFAEGATVSAYAADGYKGAEIADWGAPVATGTLDAGGVYQFYFDNPKDAKYFRFVGVAPDGTTYNTEAIPVDEIVTVGADKPVVSFGSVSAIEAGSADINFAMLSCGAESTCTVTAKFGYLANELEFSKTIEDVGLGTGTIHLDDLEPLHTYYLTLTAANGSSEMTTATTVFTTPVLPTRATVTGDAPGYSLPGVWQADESGGLTVPITEHPTRVRTLGTWAADVYFTQGSGPYWTVWTLDGEEKQMMWYNGAHFGYAGYMYLEKGKSYTIAGNIDDNVRFKIDGVQKLSGNGSFSYSPGYTGWHPFEATAIDISGWAGSSSGMGFSVTPSGGSAKHIRDPGDGSFLRTAPGVRDGEVVEYSISEDGVFTAEIAFGAIQSTPEISLYAAYGKNLGGIDYASWERTKQLNGKAFPITADYNGFPVEMSGAGSDFRYVHFYTVDANGTWQWCGETIVVGDRTRPLFSSEMSADGTMGDTIRFKGQLLTAGSGETAALSFLIATKDDLSDAVAYETGRAYAAGDEIEYDIFEPKNSAKYIKPGAKYYVRAVFTGANGKRNVSAPLEVTMRSAATFKAGSFAAPVNSDTAVCYVSGILETVGANTNAVVEFYAGMGNNDFRKIDSVTITEDNTPFSFEYTVPKAGDVVYFYCKVINQCSTQYWAVDSDIMNSGTVYLYYHWKKDVHKGRWTDPKNWEVAVAEENGKSYPNMGLDPTGTYPQTTSRHLAIFEDDGSGEPYEITLDGYVDVYRLEYRSPGMDVRFVGKGYGEGYHDRNKTGIYQADNMYAEYFAADSHVTFRNMYLDFARVYFNRNTTITIDNTYARMRGDSDVGSYTSGATLELINEAIYAHEGGNFFGNGSNYQVIIDNSIFTMPSTGRLYMNRDANSTGENYIRFYGTHPKLQSHGWLVACADYNGAAPANLTLMFHVPEGGYEEPPIIGSGVENFAAGNKALKMAVAADSPGLVEGCDFDVNLMQLQIMGGVNYGRVSLDTTAGRALYYADAKGVKVSSGSADTKFIRAHLTRERTFIPTGVHFQ